ncbi:energy transducer TonB [Desulfovibrio litoralis]|uniref:TolA protein n=1 Tax=Desulfovibrio litoralis DSM 11393 TaxID=1121455 RepID=A0A1M7RVS7_9BACT|nr:energy transducer TonB [Desulfovibrio litoralis]SHN50409.1 TolA protein [Desulfovibrio litoralis DSM 11393]
MAILKNSFSAFIIFLLVILSLYNLSLAQTTKTKGKVQPVEITVKDAEIISFMHTIGNLVRQQWTSVPRSEIANLVATVRVSLLPDGTIKNFVLEESSGSPAYDSSVLSAVSKVKSFPKPPNPDLQVLLLKFNYNEMTKR